MKVNREGDTIELGRGVNEQPCFHVFGPGETLAIDAALEAGRPLLLRGEPGVGKTQLAQAAAVVLERKFKAQTVDAQTGARDLEARFDAVARLAKAQVLTAANGDIADLDEANFVAPGPLWWAFDWMGAWEQENRWRQATGARALDDEKPEAPNGVVALIDEIDKADADVPNGLLEALGSGSFHPRGVDSPVIAKAPWPLIIVTTNEERALPDAFLRRCVVHTIRLPDESEEALAEHLLARGRAHFADVDDKVLEQAAKDLWRDRSAAKQEHRRPYPGQAEYLDLIRAARGLHPGDADAQHAALASLEPYVFDKYADDR